MKQQMQPFLPATAAFASGMDSPTSFLERCLAKIEEREHDVAAFVALDIGGAKKAASESTLRWQTGMQLSPIDGMPIGVKDIMETAAMPTGEGSPLFEGRRTNRIGRGRRHVRTGGAPDRTTSVDGYHAAVDRGNRQE
jgi:Asp-tRNA(Asn)/Glu-tRNA(Gln) amidotransferase A subunit family amidase